MLSNKSRFRKNFLLQLFLSCLATMFVSCNGERGTIIDVKYVGALKNMMKKGDISPLISLDSLPEKDHLYALGAMAGLKGEVQIFNGNPMNTYSRNGKVTFDTTYNSKATLLVYSQIEKWNEIAIQEDIKTMKQLEKYIKHEANKAGINTGHPFPFLILGKLTSVNWHVINWKGGDADHSHEKHITSGPHGQLQNIGAEILGFYSDQHKGIFTHHTSHMHMHANIPSHNIAGHVDDLILGAGTTLFLPKVTG